MGKFILALAMAAAILLGATTPAYAWPRITCDSTCKQGECDPETAITGDHHKFDIFVPKGHSCYILDASFHNLTAAMGADEVVVDSSTASGKIDDSGTNLFFVFSTSVTGNARFHGDGVGVVCNSDFGGAVDISRTVDEFLFAGECLGNSVDGNVTVMKSAAGSTVLIVGDQIDGDLNLFKNQGTLITAINTFKGDNCSGNASAPTGSGNTKHTGEEDGCGIAP